MFKKIQLAFLICCTSASSYAYVIGVNFTVENKTGVPMVLIMQQPNGQKELTKPIPAHQISHVYIENGDYTGLLYQMSTAPLKIMGANDHKVYLQARVAYYVGASVWNKYSFLNAISAAPGLNVDSGYTCKNGGSSRVFENKIVIDGKPGSELQVKEFPAEVSCQGLKSSSMDDRRSYFPVCFDEDKATYDIKKTYSVCVVWLNDDETCYRNMVYTRHYNEGRDSDTITLKFGSEYPDDTTLRAALDKNANAFCGSW